MKVTVAGGEATEEPVLVLEEGGVIAGTIVDLRGRPCREAEFRVTSPGAPEFDPGAVTPKDGRLSVGPFPAGRYRIEATDGIGRAVADAEVTPGETTRVVLRLECGRAFSVTALDAAGAGIRGAVVTIRSRSGKEVRLDSRALREEFGMEHEMAPEQTWDDYERRHRTTGADGHVLVRLTPPGEYRLEVVAPDGRRAAAGVAVKESGYARVTVTLE